MDKNRLIQELISDTEEIVATVESNFLSLDQDQLTARPAPDRWSILECIEHMNKTHYESKQI